MRARYAAWLIAVLLPLGLDAHPAFAQLPASRRPMPPSAWQDNPTEDADGIARPQIKGVPAATTHRLVDDRDAPPAPGAESYEVANELVAPAMSGPGQPMMAPSGAPCFTPDCCVPDCCCPPPCCRCPSWNFYGGAIFLHQNQPGHATVLTTPIVGAAVVQVPLVTANQFSPDLRFGYELGAIRRNVGCSCWDAEVRYFGINRWNSTTPAVTAAGAVNIPFSTTIVAVGAAGSVVSTDYNSLLQNVELNGRRSVNDWLQAIVGVRYIAFNDAVGVTSVPLAGATLLSGVKTHNNLIGPQMGANAFLWQRGRTGVQAFGKAGIYGNAASNNVSVNNGALASGANGGHTSFVGELGVVSTFRFNNHWGLRTTSELLWIDGVARAPDQIAISNPTAGVGGIATNGALFFYGGFVGLEYNR